MTIILYYNLDELLKIVPSQEAIDKLYYLEARVPKYNQVTEYMEKHPNNEITSFFEKHSIKKGIALIKRNISKLDDKIPLYDIYSQNLYLITKFNVYNRVVYQHYRFPTKTFIDRLRNAVRILEVNQTTDPLEQRKRRKLLLMVSFLRSFNIDVLQNTYIKVFYFYANEVGKNITTCKRPSFLPHFTHITPYYSRNEVINLALNMGAKLEDKYYEKDDLDKLCSIISINDISAETLLKHQRYIIDENKLGLVQYYTLQGSYFMNQYLRNLTTYDYQNDLLENIIREMWELLNGAPAFDKGYTVYRFVSDDSYLKHLNIGDTYTEPGFISTTRDPFYQSDLYKFGFILIKINIPKDVRGVAMCIETVSHFPDEQEIILGPLSILKLDKKDKNISYYHTDENFRAQIKTRYEFTFLGKRGGVKFSGRKVGDLKAEHKTIDFLSIVGDSNSVTLEEKIQFFVCKYLNPMFQFKTVIGGKEFTIICERYDSTGAYKKFYAVVSMNGFCIYAMHNNYILFMCELAQSEKGDRVMYVNYYVKYSALDREKIMGTDNFIKFISSVAFYFAIGRVVILADYVPCDLEEVILRGGVVQRGLVGKIYQPKEVDKFKKDISSASINSRQYLGGSYCVDFYKYLKYGEKKYKDGILNIELRPKFMYDQLDLLRDVDHLKILKKDDQDELYQIYDKVYKNARNIADYYLWIAENKCYLMDVLVAKMERFFHVDNPFENDWYVLDPVTFLYNRRYVQTFPAFVVDGGPLMLKDSKNIMPKNEYRSNVIRGFSD
ncbi:MAG: ADP-ribosyltransferase exoenzyme domain protein [Harvfovirus sp.]|uniref:ADP-ribosyltransferase exoenzyme domain protein n=1 Tax=Harvfovirus sp. TaxID=2487768 RepID=A0A3G5A255_9VIRU|nr:MAG: ADP-ribosyltransferase exoenzyme domain protein [Harvfovirus sp.]